VARQVLQVLANQIEQTESAVRALERELLAWHKTNPVNQRLASIPGIGPIIATAIATTAIIPSKALWSSRYVPPPRFVCSMQRLHAPTALHNLNAPAGSYDFRRHFSYGSASTKLNVSITSPLSDASRPKRSLAGHVEPNC
jgi:hypothetical protein